jgi:hypothetical protein
MRFQVRVGEQYQELLEHLEGFKPEYRGKRLLALAAMQLSGGGATKNNPALDNDKTEVELSKVDAVESSDGKAADTEQVKSRKKPPTWIKQNANS